MGLDSHILQWLGNYLYNRQQRVVVNADSLPDLASLRDGFKSPTVYYVCWLCVSCRLVWRYLISTLPSYNSLLSKHIRCTMQLACMQSDTDKIGQWSQENFLTLNTSYCKTTRTQCVLLRLLRVTCLWFTIQKTYKINRWKTFLIPWPCPQHPIKTAKESSFTVFVFICSCCDLNQQIRQSRSVISRNVAEMYLEGPLRNTWRNFFDGRKRFVIVWKGYVTINIHTYL